MKGKTLRTEWLCEQHPTKLFPHDDCPGPGVPPNLCNLADAFVRGYACAVATLQRMDGTPTLTTEVGDLMKACGLTEITCREAHVDEYDMAALFPPKGAQQ